VTDLLIHSCVSRVLLAPCMMSASVRVHAVIIVEGIVHSTSLLLIAELVQHTKETLTVHTCDLSYPHKVPRQCSSGDQEKMNDDLNDDFTL
jgi:hypothetical protein